MSLKTIVRALGGDLYDGGRRANIPAPGHSRRDRSVSLLERDGRIIVHTFGDGDWRGVRDYLRGQGLLPGPEGPRPAPSDPAREEAHRASQRLAVARALWASGRPLAGTLSERHCRGRGVPGLAAGPHALRHHPAAPVSVYRGGGPTRPALMAGVMSPRGELTAVELTYLTPGGRRAFDLALPRKTVGLLAAGSAVRLDAAASRMLVAEGVFTALAARAWFGLPAWALLSTSNLRVWRAPPGTVSVLVAADRGRDGEASADRLARALVADGIEAKVALPPPPFGDWDEARRGGRPGPGSKVG